MGGNIEQRYHRRLSSTRSTNLMLDLTNHQSDTWPDTLSPIGEGSFDKEPFEDWWNRNGARLANLHPQIAEQWVYKHWSLALFKFLELDRLAWSVHQLSTLDYLKNVHLEFGGPCVAEHDYHVFEGAFRGRKTATAENWCDGTWTFPPLVLSTPEGIIGHEGEFPTVRMVVVEGSLRYRYLSCLHERGEDTGPHDFYLLESPLSN